jgi:hypothetical protein
VKLVDILNEIKVIPSGRQILWGETETGRFTELVKIRGYRTYQQVENAINQALNLPNDTTTKYKLDVNYTPEAQIPNENYVYIIPDGVLVVVDSLSKFGTDSGYDTEEGWGVAEWVKQPPRFP